MINNESDESCMESAREPSWEAIVVAAFDTLLFLTALLSNGVVVAIIYKKPRLRKKSSSHLINLVIGNCLYCLSLPLTLASLVLGGWTFGRVFCQVHGFFILWAVLSIEFNFPIFAIYRLLVILRSQNRFADIYKTHTLYLHLLTWGFAFVCAFPPLVGWGRLTHCEETPYCFLNLADSQSYVIFLVFATTVVPLLIMVICYGKVISTVRQSSKRVQTAAQNTISASSASLAACDDQGALRAPTPGPQYTDRDFLPLPGRQPPRTVPEQRRTSVISNSGGRRRENRRFSLVSIASSTMSNVRPSEQRLGRSLGLITVSYLCTWLPVVVCLLRATFSANVRTEMQIHLLQLFLYFHAAVNPLVYGLLTDPFKSAILKILKLDNGESSQDTQRWIPPTVVSSVPPIKAVDNSCIKPVQRPDLLSRNVVNITPDDEDYLKVKSPPKGYRRPSGAMSVLSATSNDDGPKDCVISDL